MTQNLPDPRGGLCPTPLGGSPTSGSFIQEPLSAPKGRLLELSSTNDRPAPRVSYPKRIYTKDPWAFLPQDGAQIDYQGDCESPVNVELRHNRVDVLTGKSTLTHTEVRVRCRKCQTCRVACGRMWIARAIQEMSSAHRSWFLSLTFDWRRLDTTAPWDYARSSVTRFVKRLRYEGCKCRYLGVFEAHKTGLPHAHVLLHEIVKDSVLWKIIDKQWTDGFHETHLVKDDPVVAARYTCKYLFKSEKQVRIRASRFYGGARHGSLLDALRPSVA